MTRIERMLQRRLGRVADLATVARTQLEAGNLRFMERACIECYILMEEVNQLCYHVMSDADAA